MTNTGATIVTGDVGVSPGTAITGFPPGTLTGTMHSNDAVAQGAQSDLATAYNALASQACNTDLTGTDLGGLTLTSAVYCFSSTAQLTGTLTLDAQGNPNAVFVFQIGSALTTASAANVLVINGGSDCNVFWQAGSSDATMEFAAAKSYCAGLALNGHAWRVPTMTELTTLVEGLKLVIELNNQFYQGPKLSVAIGSALCERPGGLERALRAADDSMYAAKRAHYQALGSDRRKP